MVRYRPGSSIDQPLGIVLLSFAHFHQYRWVDAFAAHPRAEIVGLWDADRRRGEEAAAQFGLRFEPDVETLLKDPRAHAAAICSETSSHLDLVERAGTAGLHIFCEKPIARTLAEFRRIREAVQRAGVVYYQSSPQRLIESNRRIRDLVVSGAIGRVTHVRKRHGHHFGLEGLGSEMPWIVNGAEAGGGALLDEGVHETDMLAYLLGYPEEVTAVTAAPRRFEVESSGVAVYRFKDDVLAVLESAWNWVAGGPTTEVYGDEGVIIESLTDRASNSPGGYWPHLALFRKSVNRWEREPLEFDFGTIHSLAPKDFVDTLLSGGEPCSSLDDGGRALEMILAAYASAASGRTVRFPFGGGSDGSGAE